MEAEYLFVNIVLDVNVFVYISNIWNNLVVMYLCVYSYFFYLIENAFLWSDLSYSTKIVFVYKLLHVRYRFAHTTPVSVMLRPKV